MRAKTKSLHKETTLAREWRAREEMRLVCNYGRVEWVIFNIQAAAVAAMPLQNSLVKLLLINFCLRSHALVQTLFMHSLLFLCIIKAALSGTARAACRIHKNIANNLIITSFQEACAALCNFTSVVNHQMKFFISQLP
jgi:hypothetical protein